MPYEIKKTKSGKIMFNRKAGNNEILLTSEMYERKESALNGIASARANGAKDDNFDVKTASNGKSFFVLKAANKEVIGKSEMYASTSGAKRGIASVKRNCTSAVVKDLTQECCCCSK
jgi:uncharacterized protein YegP (UPF0339 family)